MRKNSIKNRIYDYTKKKNYFNIRDLREYLEQNNIKYTDENLKKSLYRMNKDEIIYDAGRGWYSTIKDEFNLDKRPVKKIINLINKDFPFLEFSCWSTEQLKAFYHHVPAQFVIFIFSEKEFLESLKDCFENHNYNVFLNPLKAEAEKFVHFKDQTIILRPSITSREPKDKHFARIEKIIVDLYMESRKINLIDREEYKKIISNIFHNFRIDLADVLEYAERRGIKDKIFSFVH
jgi:hypothetical protein